MNELNYVLTRILDMDSRAAQVKEDAFKQLDQMEQETKGIIAALEETMAQQLEKELESYRQREVIKAQEQSRNILEKARKEGAAMEEAYSKNKESLVQKAMQRLTAGS